MTAGVWGILLALSVAVGVSLGLIGGGGSILTTPMLVYIGGADPKQAIAESLIVVGATSAVAVIGHHQRGRVAWAKGFAFAAGGVPGALLGGRAAGLISGTASLLLFAGSMILASASMARPRTAPAPDPAASAPRVDLRWQAAQLVAVGAGVGLFTGFVGAGGGFLIVPALAGLGGLGMQEAIGTSVLVIALNCAAGYAGHAGHVGIDAPVTAAVTAAAVVGALAGSRLVDRVRPEDLRRAFSTFVFVVALFVFGNTLYQASR